MLRIWPRSRQVGMMYRGSSREKPIFGTNIFGTRVPLLTQRGSA